MASQPPTTDAPEERFERILKAVKEHVFLSVMQHMMTLQSEPELITRLSGGDMHTLANSQGLMGLLSLVLTQTGGRVSDVTGRKAGLLLGPVLNVLGVVVFSNASSRSVVVACRILRMIVTSFSNTVMVHLLGLSALAGANLAITLRNVPETLGPERRKLMGEVLTLAVCNPFGFIKLYRHGSVALQRMVTITTLQMCLEGKNLSDLVQTWCRGHLLWRPEATRNFIMGYGVLCMVAGIHIHAAAPVNFVIELSMVRTSAVSSVRCVMAVICICHGWLSVLSGLSGLHAPRVPGWPTPVKFREVKNPYG